MSELESTNYQRPAFATFILVLVVTLTGFIFLGPVIGVIISIAFSGESVVGFLQKLEDPSQYPEIKKLAMIVQGSSTLFGLIMLPALYWWAIEKRNPFKEIKRFKPFLLVLVPLLVISFTVVDSVIIDWNANLAFPDFLKGFENWARSFESRAAEVTKFLTTFDSFGDFIFGMIVIAVLPGIGEELVFRGFLQPTLVKITQNIHVSIWFIAILFSAIHMQFFGFVPRMLLGALFGYLYYWSGNLAIPMLAHFLNNGLSVLGIYLYQQGKIKTNIEETTVAPWPVILVCTVLTAFLLVQFQRYYKPHNHLIS